MKEKQNIEGFLRRTSRLKEEKRDWNIWRKSDGAQGTVGNMAWEKIWELPPELKLERMYVQTKADSNGKDGNILDSIR